MITTTQYAAIMEKIVTAPTPEAIRAIRLPRGNPMQDARLRALAETKLRRAEALEEEGA